MRILQGTTYYLTCSLDEQHFQEALKGVSDQLAIEIWMDKQLSPEHHAELLEQVKNDYCYSFVLPRNRGINPICGSYEIPYLLRVVANAILERIHVSKEGVPMQCKRYGK